MEKIYINATKVETQYIETNYNLEEFAKPKTEEYDIKVNYVHGYNENGLIPIKQLQALLEGIKDEIEMGEITHIDISFNEDHGEYEFATFKLEIVDPVELKEDPTDKILDMKIKALEDELRDLKNQRLRIGDDDDLPF